MPYVMQGLQKQIERCWLGEVVFLANGDNGLHDCVGYIFRWGRMYEKIKGEAVIIHTVDHMDFSGVVGDSLESSRGKCVVLEGQSIDNFNQKFAIVPLQDIRYVVGIKQGNEPIAAKE